MIVNNEARMKEALRHLKIAVTSYLSKHDPWDLKEVRYWADVLNQEIENAEEAAKPEKPRECVECGRRCLQNNAVLCPSCAEDQ